MPVVTPAVLADLKQRVAQALARSRLDYTDHLLILNAFLRDFRWEEGNSSAAIKRHWKRLLHEGFPPNHNFSVYMHVPYCATKCHFCYCSVQASPTRAMIDGYVPELQDEIRAYAPLFAGIPVRLLQVGGGTPNLLSASQLSGLLGAAAGSFSIDPDGMRTIEFNPSKADAERLAAVRRAGFNRVSFGVQSLNPKVLERENREYQTFEMTRDAVGRARELGFEVVNVDLLLGLATETAESFLEGFAKVAGLRPTTITVTGLSLTDAYLKVMKTDRGRKLVHYEEVLPAAVAGMRRLGRRHGYETQDVKPNRANWVLFADETPREVLERVNRGDHFSGGTLSVLGLGRLAWSHVFGRCIYERDLRTFSPSAPVYRVARMSRKEEMMRYVLYALENRSRVEYAEFRSRFAADVREAFSVELKALSALDKVAFDADGFSFLPVRGPERIFYGLFFLLDTLSRSPLSNGELGRPLRARLERELAGVGLGEGAAP